MPALAPDPQRPEHIARLHRVIDAMGDPERRRFLASIKGPDYALVERLIAEKVDTHWRSDPARMAHHVTDGEYRLWPYVQLLSTKFRQAIMREDPKQVWNVPSQVGKTTGLCTVGVPWTLQHDPSLRILYVTYDADKAVEEGGKARDWIRDHPEYGIELMQDRRARGMWRTKQGGGLYAVGIFGGITGWPADVILLDDLVKGWREAHSEAQRNTVWSIYKSQIRLRAQRTDTPIIAAGTRWHEDDPSGRLMEESDDPHTDRFTPVILRALAEDDDPLGRKRGEPLEPERFPLEEVLARHAILGSYLTAAMEQQRPSPEEGGEIKRAWWRIEDTAITKADQWASSADMKLKDRESGDYTVIQIWGRTGGDYWCIDQLRGQWSQAVTRVAMALMQVRHPQVRTHYVENAGYGPEVMDNLRLAAPNYEIDDEVADLLGIVAEERTQVEEVIRNGMSGLIPVTPKGSKDVRARAVTPLIEAGNVHLAPATAGWVHQLVDECAAFGPGAAHDDQVDAMSQALSQMSRGGASLVNPANRRAPKVTASRGANMRVLPQRGRLR